VGRAREREAVTTDTSERNRTTRRSEGLTPFIGFAGWFLFTASGPKNAKKIKDLEFYRVAPYKDLLKLL
jgi:CRISPR/Cas system endoribonuclease Cas6 (RAMP superfamily)